MESTEQLVEEAVRAREVVRTELAAIGADLLKADEEIAEARELRNQAILDARSFLSTREIAEHAQVSGEHVRQVLRGLVEVNAHKAAHAWLRRHYEHEKTACEVCGTTESLEWAYRGRGGEWTRDRSMYRVLCQLHHKRYDAAKRRRVAGK